MLEELLRHNPDDRGVLARLGQALVLHGRLLARQGREAEARAAWARAAQLLASVAGSSRDYQLLDPWVRAMLLLGRLSEVGPVVETLRGMGYREVTYQALCHEKTLCPEPSAT
jgi:hypothetical protein